MYRALAPTVSFFLVLQGAALAGALWASRIKRRLDPHARLVPNQKRGIPCARSVESIASVAGSPPRSWRRRCSPSAPRRRWPTIRCRTRSARFQTTPTAYSVPGYTKPDPGKATTKDLAVAVDAVAQSASHSYLLDQLRLDAGRRLPRHVHAGRASRWSRPASSAPRTPRTRCRMNFMVYALGMFGFFICGFALHVRRLQRHRHRRPGDARRHADAELRCSPSARRSTAITAGASSAPPASSSPATATTPRPIVLFLFMMVFMDTTATIVTGAWPSAGASRASSSSASSSARFIYPVFGCWVWGGGWLAQLGYRLGPRPRRRRLRRLRRRPPAGRRARAHHRVSASGRASASTTRTARSTPILAAPHPDGACSARSSWPSAGSASTPAARWPAPTAASASSPSTPCSPAWRRRSSGMLYMWMRPPASPIPSMMCNSMLAGLVAITAPCAFVTPVGAFIIGAVAGVLVIWSVFFFDKIEDRRSGRRDQRPRRQRRLGRASRSASSPTAATARAGTASARPTTSASPAKGVTGLFYGDSQAARRAAHRGRRRHRLERRRRRRRLLGHRQARSAQPRVGRGRDRRAGHPGDGRRAIRTSAGRKRSPRPAIAAKAV